MSAQSAVDPSMEDILASIRKIIADDSADEAEGNNDVDAQANEAGERVLDRPIAGIPTRNPDAINPNPALQPNPSAAEFGGPRAEMDRGQSPDGEKPLTLNPPPALQERRENLETPVSKTSPQPNPSVGPGTKPLSWPSVTQVPLSLAREIASANSAINARARKQQEHLSEDTGNGAEQNPQSEVSAAIPGFVENKPLSKASQNPIDSPRKPENTPQINVPQKPIETDVSLQPEDAPLHPAIANAKAFVSSQGANKGAIKMPENPEKPVFAQSSRSPLAEIRNQAEPLVSPDSIERREVVERRNHPLRRGADRDEAGFNADLMSPQTDNAVHGAFERLKISATEGLDPKVEALLRPMLREWLDNNLPSMVERLVRNEIERVSRGE